MDVKTIFLNDDLEEEIYMTQPEGCVVHGQENKVCKLLKSLYGLKQALKQWHEKFNETLIVDDFSSRDADRCMYTKSVNDNHVIICLYVDDMLIFGTCNDIVFKTKSFLTSIDVKDIGEASVILGVKIIRNEDNILLSQEHYVEKLRKYKYYVFKLVSTPYDANSQRKIEEKQLFKLNMPKSLEAYCM